MFELKKYTFSNFESNSEIQKINFIAKLLQNFNENIIFKFQKLELKLNSENF